jgi:hypothetical protein
MQRLSSFKDRHSSRNPPNKQPNINVIVPGAKQPEIGRDLLDLPRFKSRQQIANAKYFSSEKAKASKAEVDVEAFVAAKGDTMTE